LPSGIAREEISFHISWFFYEMYLLTENKLAPMNTIFTISYIYSKLSVIGESSSGLVKQKLGT
jgi:hypothetical protein